MSVNRDDGRIGEALSRLCPDWQTSLVTDIDYLEGGYSNDNFALRYQGQRYVLRLPGIRQPYVDPEREAHWYGQLPASVRTARPIALDPSTGEMLTPWVDGVLLVDIWPGATETAAVPDDGLLSQAVAYLSGLHGVLPPLASRYPLDELVAGYIAGTPQEIVDVSALVAKPELSSVCHNDLNPWNIIVTGEGWVTLDWEMVGTNDPLFDVVTLYEGLGLPRSGLMRFAERVVGLPAEELIARTEQNLRAFWIRERSWAIFQRDRGNRRTEVLEQIEDASAKLAELDAR